MTTSYPAVGNGGLTADNWAATFGARDGIIEDYGNAPGAFAMTLLNATNEAQFTAGKISNNGYVLDVSDGSRVSLPAPTSGSKVYYIGNLYDPALNVPIPGSNPPTADPLGPCRLTVFDTTIDASNGKRFLIQYVVTRTSAALTGAVVEDRRRWVGDTVIEYADGVGSDSFPGNEGTYPRGTLRKATNRFLLRTLNSSGVLSWIDPLLAGPFAFPAVNGLVSAFASPSTPQYLRYAGTAILCRGTLKRSSGANLSTGSDVVLGTLPVGFRPPFLQRFSCIVSGNKQTEVRVDSNGVVTMTNPASSCTWIDLSAITFRAEN